MTLFSRSFVKRLKNEIAVKSLKCEQKAANSWIARMLLRNRAELRSCITPPTTQCGPVPLPELSSCTPEWVEQVAVPVTEGTIMPIVDRIGPIALFQSCIQYSVAGRGWGKIVTRLVDWLNNVQHPLSKEVRTEVPILGQYL